MPTPNNLRKRRKPNPVLTHVELGVHIPQEHIADDPEVELVRGHDSTDTCLRSSGHRTDVEQGRRDRERLSAECEADSRCGGAGNGVVALTDGLRRVLGAGYRRVDGRNTFPVADDDLAAGIDDGLDVCDGCLGVHSDALEQCLPVTLQYRAIQHD